MGTPTLEVGPEERTPRLWLKSDGPATGDVDGAWWPGSRDLTGELPALLAALGARLGAVERVTYNLSVWDPPPRRLAVDGRVVRLEGFLSQPADVVTVVGRGGRRRLTLLVVPPDTDPATAERVVARASRPGNAENIRALLGIDATTGRTSGSGERE